MKYNLLIGGIPVKQNENCVDIMCKIGNELGVKIDKSDIIAAHRLQETKSKAPPNIIVKFLRYSTKSSILMKLKEVKYKWNAGVIEGVSKTVFFNDHLTARRRHLLWKARLAKEVGYLSQAWTTGGKIYVKKQEKDRPTMLQSIADLQTITQNNLDGLLRKAEKVREGRWAASTSVERGEKNPVLTDEHMNKDETPRETTKENDASPPESSQGKDATPLKITKTNGTCSTPLESSKSDGPAPK